MTIWIFVCLKTEDKKQIPFVLQRRFNKNLSFFYKQTIHYLLNVKNILYTFVTNKMKSSISPDSQARGILMFYMMFDSTPAKESKSASAVKA